MLNINRRTFFFSSFVSAVTNQALAQEKKDLSANQTYGALRSHLNGNDGIYYYTGTYWGKPHSEIARPLFRVEGIGFNTLKIDQGRVSQKLSECGFWFHPDTNTLADDWINPMNGLDCNPRHYKSSQSVIFDSDGKVERDESLPKRVLSISGNIKDPIILGKKIWSQENLIIKINQGEPAIDQDPLSYTGPVISLNSLATYNAFVSDLYKEFVPATLHFQSLSPWYPWMKMGQRAGVCSFELVGIKLRDISEIPKKLLSILKERRPGFIDNPWV